MPHTWPATSVVMKMLHMPPSYQYLRIFGDTHCRASLPARLALAAGGADLGIGGLVRGLGVHADGVSGGVPESLADGLDRDSQVDELGGVRVPQLVDPDLGAGGGAVLLPPALGGVVGQRPAAPVDGSAEQRAGGVPGAGEVEPQQGDVAAVVEQDG